MQKIREMIDANTIVGEPISTPDGITLIPISKLSFGFIGGGSDFTRRPDKNGFGGGTGAGVNVIPVAFLVVKGKTVEMIYIEPPSPSNIDKIINVVPDVLDKVTDFLGKEKEEA